MVAALDQVEAGKVQPGSVFGIGGPAVEVLAMAADRHLPVDRRAAADAWRLTARSAAAAGREVGRRVVGGVELEGDRLAASGRADAGPVADSPE